MSNTAWVWIKSAPASTFCISLMMPRSRGFRHGVGDGAGGHRKGAVYLLAVQELSLLAHLLDEGDQLRGIEIIDIRRLGIVRQGLMVTRKAEDVPDSQGCRAQQVGLDGDPVSVAGDDLVDRFNSRPGEDDRCRQAGHGNAEGVIRDIDRRRDSRQRLQDRLDRRPSGFRLGEVFGRNDEISALQLVMKWLFVFHYAHRSVMFYPYPGRDTH